MIELNASPRLKASLGMLVALQDKPMYQGTGHARNKVKSKMAKASRKRNR